MLDTAKEWAQRLLAKYGIMQPMAPEEPPMCAPVGFASASYPAFFDNVRQKDAKPVIGYPSSLVTRDDAYERRRRDEEEQAAARRRREADDGSSALPLVAVAYAVSSFSYDSGSSFSYDSGSSSSSSCDSGGSSGGGCE